MRSGGCQCGNLRYQAEGDPMHHALCHCTDCRASSGAPATAWIAFAEAQVKITKGEVSTYAGKNGALRYFCGNCGTGLLYTNAVMLPGVVDIQSATLDNAGDETLGAQIQYAERLGWLDNLDGLPRFDRFPGM